MEFFTYGSVGGPVASALMGNRRLYPEELADVITGGEFHLGVAELVSKDNFGNHYLSYSHNLVGCPETEIWTDAPSEFTNVNITDNGSSLTVNTGVGGCVISACSGNKGASYFEVADNTSSHTFNTSVRPLYITVTQHNYIPYKV